MKKLILVLGIALLSCSKSEVEPTYCWTYTTSCDYLGNGNPKVKTYTECNGTDADMAEAERELLNYGCVITSKSKK